MKCVDPALERAILAAGIRRPSLLDHARPVPELFASADLASLAGELVAAIEHVDPDAIEVTLRERRARLVAEVVDGSDPLRFAPAAFVAGVARLRVLATARTLLQRVDRVRASLVEADVEAATSGLSTVLEGVDGPAGHRAGTFGEAAEAYLRNLMAEERAGNERERGIVGTGMRVVDGATRGLRRGALWVVGGRSGCRKSSMILRAALHALRAGHQPTVVSVEDPEAVWGERITSLVAAEARLGTDTAARVQAAALASQLQGRIVYPLDGTPAAVLECVRRGVQDGAGIVFVDYVQAIQFPDVRRLDKATANFARGGRTICRRTGAVFVLGSQVTTERGHGHKEPSAIDLRESRELLEAADVVTLTWKPDAERDDHVLGRVAKVKWAAGGQPFHLEITEHGVVVDAHFGHPDEVSRDVDDGDDGGGTAVGWSS